MNDLKVSEMTPTQLVLATEVPILEKCPMVDMNDFEAVKSVTCTFLHECNCNGIIPKVTALAHRLGRSKSGLYKWIATHPDSKTAEFFRMVSDTLADCLAESALNGKAHPILTIFLLKNHFGFKDSVELQTAAPIDNGIPSDSVDSIKARYLYDAANNDDRPL